MLDLYNNKNAFLKKQPKYEFIIVVLSASLLLWLLYYMCSNYVYDHYQTKGIVLCDDKCIIKTTVSTEIDFEKINLNNKDLNYEIIEQELIVDEENYLTYYELTLSIEDNLTNNEIVDLNFYYNKQRIITKIKEKMF